MKKKSKKLLLLVLLVSWGGGLSAQEKSTLFDRSVIPLWGYYYTSAYPVGLYEVINGYFFFPPMRVGFNFCPKADVISEMEYRKPTWTLQFCPMLGFGFNDELRYGWLAGFDIGADFVKRYFTDPPSGTVTDTKCTPYFSFTLKAGIFVHYAFDFIIGYEFVPAYKHLSGFTFGLGLSIPPH